MPDCMMADQGASERVGCVGFARPKPSASQESVAATAAALLADPDRSRDVASAISDTESSGMRSRFVSPDDLAFAIAWLDRAEEQDDAGDKSSPPKRNLPDLAWSLACEGNVGWRGGVWCHADERPCESTAHPRSLLDAVHADARENFHRLHAIVADPVRRFAYARRLASDREACRSVADDALTRAYLSYWATTAPRRWGGHSRITTTLCAIAWNVAREGWRAGSRNEDDDQLATLPDEPPTAWDMGETLREFLRHLEDRLAETAPRGVEIFRLLGRGLRPETVAASLGLKVQSVYTQRVRIRLIASQLICKIAPELQPDDPSALVRAVSRLLGTEEER